jgi:glycosyltransferase involved in cell wall biosynthesis
VNPLISIITINYDDAPGLERTIRSVAAQTYRGYEYIVIDGGSKDESKKVIEQLAVHISYWVSEPDKGVYNAMNKGIAKASGEYLLFLNSGDVLEDNDSLSRASKYLGNDDLVYFDLQVQQADGQRRLKTYPDQLDFRYFIFESLPHPGSFIRKTLFDAVGLYNESFKIASDWAFFLIAICKNQCRYKHVASTVSVFHLDGISSIPGNQELIVAEKKQVLHEHFLPYKNLYDELLQADGLRQTFEQSTIIRFFKRFGFFR